jgi:phage terminase large subunit-like protein
MIEEVEHGPDPNAVRRHAKKLLTETEYRKRYSRLDYYRPNRKQLAFHNLIAVERMLRANNQGGKTHAAGAQMAMDALGRYFGWYEGRRFDKPPAIERPFNFLGWVASTTSTTTRDGAQTKLLGDIRQPDGLGTGMLPLDHIVGRPTMARGISDFVDTVTVRRDDGGTAAIRFKTYEMDRRAFQGEACDEIWLDEDSGDDDVYGECLARLTATRGQIIFSATPVLGVTPVRKRFKTKQPGTAEVLMTIEDCLVSNGGHIPDEDLPALMSRYKESERATRLYGADMQGEGAVFETPVERIKHTRDYRDFPPYWRWLWGLDFRHSGSATGGHPFAAVLGCHDIDADIVYIVHAVRLLGMAPMHVSAMKAHPLWQAPAAFPHDGGKGASIISGETIAQTYKKLGLRMRGTHATFRDGGFNFEAGIQEMEQRFATGRLLVARYLTEFFDEYVGFHRKENMVVKVDDDLLSATRQLVMDLRYAQAQERFENCVAQRRGEPQIADGVDYDLFNPRGDVGGRSSVARGTDYDLFAG